MAGEDPVVPQLIVLGSAGHAPLLLTSPELIIGRSDIANLVLDDPFVSRRHALVTIDPDGEVTIQDLNSTSGTFVNDERIFGPRVLRSGDLVRFADLVTRFEAVEPASRSAEADTQSATVERPATTQVVAAGPYQEPAGTGKQETEPADSPVTDYERIRAVKKAAQAGLLLIPGVHAVGVGAKTVNGERTDMPSIIVFLVKKVPESEIAANHVVPREISGVRTDVIEMDVARIHSAHDTSRPRPMLGGVAMQAKGGLEYGTLGCFATTHDNPPKVVAITNQHIVAPLVGKQPTDVFKVTPLETPNPYNITFSVQGSNIAGTLVLVKMGSIDNSTAYNAWWTVTASDTAETIAASVLQAVNSIPLSGVSAAPGSGPGNIVLTAAPGSDTVVHSCSLFDPPLVDSEVKLLAVISGNTVTLSGKADGEYCIFTSWNTNGSDPTNGAFTSVKKGATPAAIATAVATSVSALSINGITAAASAATITVQGASQVSCIITRDIRAGQPTDSFSSNCSLCCTDEMGRVLNSSAILDTAIVQVRRGLQYRNEIKGDSTALPPIGNTVIRDVHKVTDKEAHSGYPVNKRGARTGYKSGIVTALDVGGYAQNPDPDGIWTIFVRFYDNAMVVNPTGDLFTAQGDSGAAVFDNSGKVVGILWGGTSHGLVTPIDLITAGLNITVATSTGLNQPQTVTDAQGAPAVVMATDDQMIPQLLTAQAEITATPAGKQYADLVRRHAEEVQALVNTNLRVAVVWHRNSGPQIVQALFRMIQAPDQRLQEEIDGVPLAERLTRIRDALVRYGSAELTEDLSRYSPELLRLTSLTYREALAGMQTEDAR